MADGGTLRLSRDGETGDILYEDEAATVSTLTASTGHFENLVDKLEKRTIDGLCSMLTELVSFDDEGRSEWREIAAESYKLLGVGPESEPDAGLSDGDTSDHPLLLTSLIRFQSKALSALLPSGSQAVRTEPAFNPDNIEDPKEREAALQDALEAGRRVEDFYTNYLFKEVDGYETDTDQILHDCGFNGMGIRKVFTDTTRRRVPVRPIHVTLGDIILSYDAKTMRCGRVTHRMDMPTSELIRMLTSGQYRASGQLSPSQPEKDEITEEQDRISGLSYAHLQDTESHRIYEIHCDLMLNEDTHPMGLARPYIVVIHATSQAVLAVVRNWQEGDEDEQRIEHFVCYPFSPGKTATTPLGLGHILSNVTRALRDAQRAGLDAGYRQNHPSGFKLSTFKIRDDTSRVMPGEFQDVDAPVDDIRRALMIHPFQGPSQGLMALADRMEASGKELGGIATIDFSQLMKAGIAAGPAMAAYEESSTFQTAIHRRLYQAHASELRIIHERMRQVHGGAPIVFGRNGNLRQGDLLKVDILPAMKPGQASRQRDILEAQATWEIAQAAPDILDRRAAVVEYLRALGKPNLDDILLPDPDEDPPQPRDPVSEYGETLQSRPIKAGLAQNHRAHIAAHTAQMRGLQFSNLPVEQGEAVSAMLAAHIAEHMAMDMLVRVASRVGISPERFAEMPPEIEAQLAPQIAMAIEEIENERAAAAQPQQESRIAVEQVKGAQRLSETQLKQAHERQMEQLRQRHEIELQRHKDDADMEREEADNETALEIATMKNAGSRSNASAGTGASAGAGANASASARGGSGQVR